MASLWAKQQSALAIAGNIIACKRLGMTDADATAATIALLITAIKARRDNAATTKSGQRAPFDALIFSVLQLQVEGTLTDAIVNVFSTCAASPFVAGVTTDFLSMASVNLPANVPDPIAAQLPVTFASMQAVP